ncbi:DUF3306 domain-containing protein [Halomonas sp. SH5A2]|uniref:DUF3306 domain-containing protein n=1 Tax=Halomonas sp. SH5A2 TaxID=2749040 RepID=UPI00163E6C77|nr:DUF3306 domain-containing protein [Halomonas sp. SH5A2]QNI04229.1 DUF3306 domain-containing protein [Halomonas sp. SH5A2]
MSRLERWSRIKRGLEPDDQPSAPAPDAKDHSEPPRPLDETAPSNGGESAENHEVDNTESSEPTRPVPPPPGSLDDTLPDPETLEAGSDFSGFMVPGVSSALRRRALKRLWATGNYNVRDGLDDYDLDYRQQLKPMASELAGKLRRWAKKADESLAENANDTQAEQAPTNGETGQVSSSGGEASNPPRPEEEVAQDDQSDGAHTKA